MDSNSETLKEKHVIYASPNLDRVGVLEGASLENSTERHRVDGIKIPILSPNSDVLGEVLKNGSAGLVVEMYRGSPDRAHILLAKKVLKLGRKVWFFWPEEMAMECVDAERVSTYLKLWMAVTPVRVLRRLAPRVYRGTIPESYTNLQSDSEVCSRSLAQLHSNASPNRFSFDYLPTPERPVPGNGVYLRTDFWAPLSSGGSYGHTCYIAQALKRITENVVCFMPHRYSLLDEMGVYQVVMDSEATAGNERNILRASEHYYRILKAAMQALNPSYIYERLVLGNYTGARLSQELGIPYIVEYNGSEISMKRSFEGVGYEYEQIYLRAEQAAFLQATLINVVSEPIKDDLVGRGIDPDKILVNPNGVDLGTYAPGINESASVREGLGLKNSIPVVGFIGTFGGWHGIDILAEALPDICKRNPDVCLLLIGDGNLKHLVDAQIAKHQLHKQVICTGRVPQAEGARLLKACDIYVSPHNSHMVDSRFFGSPTKIFEYMAMEGGIVASDLEQIGQVLSPALRGCELNEHAPEVTNQRSVLCKPGNLAEFVDAVSWLCKHLDVAKALGRNSRQAAHDHFSWDRHVSNIWEFYHRHEYPKAKVDGDNLERLTTGDGYKDEVQNQWNQDACGSHYVKKAERHTLNWFEEAEAYRYGEYAPWMIETMEFKEHSGEKVLEIGGGLGTDLSQFARHGSVVTDLDLSAGHLALAQENFKLRGLEGEFIHHDAEILPFDDDTYDLVYSNGVIHHTPNTNQVISEIYRVLKPGGKVLIMVYAENSLNYWKIFWNYGLKREMLDKSSMGEIMSRNVEISENDARPLVKVYTAARLRKMFDEFEQVTVVKRQLMRQGLPFFLRWMPLDTAGKLMGWNLIVKAHKPAKNNA